MTGIQMTGIVLANNLSPYTQGSDISKDRLVLGAINMLLFCI